YKGYHSDAARTHGIGVISKEAEELIRVTRECFFEGIKYAKEGNYLFDISAAIDSHAVSHGYGVVRDLCGHGIGTALHEAPEIPNYKMNRRGVKLKAGMTLAIEPMINAGTWEVEWLGDEWTVVSRDHSLSAHYENTVLVTEDEPVLLTLGNSICI
ncbi:MAG: type I methionyl aminopeptidase, partial [Lachnospiraceae bacterium]|nr:type I methionyl aminopeptidase [Lachnospiraceae bacterium]